MDRDAAVRLQQGKRLKAARKAAGWRSARAAALENGWPESSYRAHEAGTRTIGHDDAERYSRRFRLAGARISPQQILFEEPGGHAAPASDVVSVTHVPLSGVTASKMRDILHAVERGSGPTIPIADLPRGDWLALRVEGDSMDRIAPDGAVIIVNRNDRKLVRHKFYVFSDQGATTFKRYVDKPVKRLEPFSTNPTHEPIYPTTSVDVVGRVYRVMLDL